MNAMRQISRRFGRATGARSCSAADYSISATLSGVSAPLAPQGLIKQALPYGVMCLWLKWRYGLEEDSPLFVGQGIVKRMRRIVKFALPYGIVAAYKRKHYPEEALAWERNHGAAEDGGVNELAERIWAKRPGNVSDRIAIFSPMPPEETGIANFSLKLHMADAGRYDVFAKVRSSDIYREQIARYGLEYNVLPYDFYRKRLGRDHAHFARVFVIGNSPFHDFAFREAMRTRGEPGRWLYLHEALIHGALLDWVNESGVRPLDYLRQWYPEKAESLDQFGDGTEWNAFCQEQGMLGVRPLVKLTGVTNIIVNNARCRRLVYEDLLPQGRVTVCVNELFLPVEMPEHVDRIAIPECAGERVIGTFGAPSALKGTPLIVEAVRHLNERGVACRLMIAGYNAKRFLKALPPQDGRHCFVPDGIEDLCHFHSLMASVDVAIQLRLSEHGESSGCVSELLGLGTPLVTNRGFVDPLLAGLCHCTSPQPSADEIEKCLLDAMTAKRDVGSYKKRLAGFSFSAASDKLIALLRQHDARRRFHRKILVDALQFDGHGIQRATDALYACLREMQKDVEIVYICAAGKDVLSAVPHRRIEIDPMRRDEEILDIVRAEQPDAIHFPFNGNPPEDIRNIAPKTKIVATVHDVIPIRIPKVLQWPEAAVAKFRDEIASTIRLSDVIFCDSRHTIKDLRELFGADEKKLTCLYFAPMVDVCMGEEPCDDVKEPFFLYNGGYCRRKGIELLLANFLTLKREGKLKSTLALTGHPWAWDGALAADLAEGKKNGWIVELGYVSDARLLWLFRHAIAMVYPSLYEGFGLPPLEAMNLGCPALVARTSSLPEVCGDGACYLENRDDTMEFRRALVRLEGDEPFRRTLIRAGHEQAARFSWTVVVEQFLDALGWAK